MIVLVHTAFRGSTVQTNMGRPEYSYYFVLREFRHMLEQIGTVIEVDEPTRDVDSIYHECTARHEPCVFLSFMPPNKVPVGLACPTIPVFAWEYATIANESFGDKARNDWRRVLAHLGACITHSSFSADSVRKELGRDFPVAVVPAPLWDRLAGKPTDHAPSDANRVPLAFDGLLIDSRMTDLSRYTVRSVVETKPEILPLPPERSEGHVELELRGVIYTAIFNPGDGRKNWMTMITAFCDAFRYTADATLILKLSHYASRDLIPEMLAYVHLGGKTACRIVIIDGYLDDQAYTCLRGATSYPVNCSHGEGQCLPLMEYMACGKPAVAPRHTAMRDYVDAACAFVVDSNLRPGTWPHDMRQAVRTLRYEIHFQSLANAYRRSFHVARNEPVVYAAMQTAARDSLRAYCSTAVLQPRLRKFIEKQAAYAGRSNQPTDDLKDG